jgi:hypothetical protein
MKITPTDNENYTHSIKITPTALKLHPPSVKITPTAHKSTPIPLKITPTPLCTTPSQTSKINVFHHTPFHFTLWIPSFSIYLSFSKNAPNDLSPTFFSIFPTFLILINIFSHIRPTLKRAYHLRKIISAFLDK